MKSREARRCQGHEQNQHFKLSDSPTYVFEMMLLRSAAQTVFLMTILGLVSVRSNVNECQMEDGCDWST